tara:strand:+ start:32 stop:265 length:234 start_codon:yes stop_codon:yes gene_type:complete
MKISTIIKIKNRLQLASDNHNKQYNNLLGTSSNAIITIKKGKTTFFKTNAKIGYELAEQILEIIKDHTDLKFTINYV